MKVVALAGGVGGARLIQGLVRHVAPEALTVVANTGDDIVVHGLHVSPDLDTITYTLGGGVNLQQGWGRADESSTVAAELRDRYGRDDWFTLGDRDLATHVVRTQLLREGMTLSQVTARIAEAWALPFTLIPMTDAPVATVIETADGQRLHFQDWWVRKRARPPIASVQLDGLQHADANPLMMAAIKNADYVVLCPSNPVVSIGPILRLPGVRESLQTVPVVGVSPIVGGRVVRGMADRLLAAASVEVSCVGVADGYKDFLDGWVIDDEDGDRCKDVAALGIEVIVTNTMMTSLDVAADLASTVLALAKTINVRHSRAPAPPPGSAR